MSVQFSSISLWSIKKSLLIATVLAMTVARLPLKAHKWSHLPGQAVQGASKDVFLSYESVSGAQDRVVVIDID